MTLQGAPVASYHAWLPSHSAGHVALRQQDVADLVLGAARELLAGASQASEPAVNRAKEILALAPQGDQVR